MDNLGLGLQPCKMDNLGLGLQPCKMDNLGLGLQSCKMDNLGLGLQPCKMDNLGLGLQPCKMDNLGLGLQPCKMDNLGLGLQPCKMDNLGSSDESLLNSRQDPKKKVHYSEVSDSGYPGGMNICLELGSSAHKCEENGTSYLHQNLTHNIYYTLEQLGSKHVTD
ncbi:hypothetical protein STEG23_009255 [Scotinomys teguina]